MFPFVRSAFNYDTDAASAESGLVCEDKSLAKQSFADECDINTIVKRFNLTGQLPENVRPPSYADFDDVMDYHSAMNAVRAAEESFYAMPADLRFRFNNDPGAFVDFCSDRENLDEMRKLGLAVPVPASEPVSSPSSGDGVGEHSVST